MLFRYSSYKDVLSLLLDLCMEDASQALPAAVHQLIAEILVLSSLASDIIPILSLYKNQFGKKKSCFRSTSRTLRVGPLLDLLLAEIHIIVATSC